ncbi:molybdopterin-binding/glycosyltransferase family 2 protein [Rhizobium sp. TRM95796]|uniref:molybdopterin-binding/glycosyltransferase family 2 protein n=1 Tax=Rhizobium sp. TRM95796 TaxID=2979862 RepID=UPI0021E9793C|nr:molybdopterin-binding/glycosyltransferase family 2 protein [Rhizobium sp. TRM95796]MCV3764303.1 molybdopterin-binding/glycosyltransferase family 2 protein [Rhizobium sp. TRM95796]
MKFGPVPLDEAEGALLAHSLRAEGLSLPKGRRLTSSDVSAIAAAGIAEAIVVRLEPGDVEEDEAAQAIADAIPKDHLTFSPATTGRVNVFAACNGLFRADRAVVDRLNRLDPAVTLATLRDHADVKAGDMVATIKIIPLAAPGAAVSAAVEILAQARPFEVQPYAALKVGLVATMLPSLKSTVMDKTAQLLKARLSASRSRLDREIRVPHRTEAVEDAIVSLLPDHDLVVVFGASAMTDFDDVIPAAIRMAGGTVIQAGLPVDPGNLLVFGEIDGKPVVGAPGCARSPKENAFDWVLSRVMAGEWPSVQEMTGWGVGGLLMEIPTRPRPRLGEARPEGLQIETVILAAGQGRRMGPEGRHKLLALFDGEPLVRRTARVAKEAGYATPLLVTGHRAAEIEAAVDGLGCRAVFNPAYEDGMASSLRAGLAAAADADGLLVLLADMPAVTAEDIACLTRAFVAAGGNSIVRAVSNGKRGNPVILPKSVFPAVMRLEGDIGARPVIEKSGLPVLDVEIGLAAHLDTDTPDAVIAAGGVLGA